MTHHPHDGGLAADLPRLLGRRRLLGLAAGAGLSVGVLGLSACAPSGGPGGPVGTAAPGEIPQETAGPFPGDGTNGPNVLQQVGVVRRDIRPSFGTSTAVAPGVPLTLDLTITSVGGAPLAGAAVYVWHCDRDGAYSLYERTDQNWLRGVQATDATGRAVFTSVFPGAYAGRWPHVHFEVYPDLDRATTGEAATTTSQLALPEDACQQVYATAGYEASTANLTGTPLGEDTVFADGVDAQLAAIGGTPRTGMTAALTVPVA